MVAGKWVSLVDDPDVPDPQDYLLRYVFVGDKFVNYVLILGGFADAHRDEPAGACTDFFDDTQGQAVLAEAGKHKPTQTPWPTRAPGEPACDCWGNLRNCRSFQNQSHAQECFELCQEQTGKDVHQLDKDGDQVACEE